MATPRGHVEKLYLSTESGTYPTEGTFSSTSGLRMYFDRFMPDAPKASSQGFAFGAVDASGNPHPDLEDFAEGPITVGARLSWIMRYSGVHAVLLGLGLGDLVTGVDGSLADWYHQARTHRGQDSVTFLHQLAKTNTTTFVEEKIVGCKAESLVLSHEVGDVMRASMTFVGSHLNFSTSTTATLPPDSLGYSPGGVGQDPIMWGHKNVSLGLTLKLEAQSTVNLSCRRWRVTLTNSLTRRYVHNGDRRTREPIRFGGRSVTAEFEIEQNDEWREAIEGYGYLYSTQGTDCDINVLMTDGYGQGFRLQLNNQRIIDVERESGEYFRKFPRFRTVARQQTGGENDDPPIEITIYNDFQRPTGYSGASGYGDIVTPTIPT